MNVKKNIESQYGLTLIEVTLVISVLLGLTSVLFVGAKAYKKGAERAKCILNVSAMQKAVRSFQNLNQMEPGDALLKVDMIGPGKMMELEPKCPNPLNQYLWRTVLPKQGTAYIDCNDVDADHSPPSTSGW